MAQGVQGHSNADALSDFVIGVTGPRALQSEPLLASQVRAVLNSIRDGLERTSALPNQFIILSPLAEGADRLVAREGLALLGAELEVVLPLAGSEYLRDFDSQKSKAEFNDLCARARRIVQPQPTASRAEAYEWAGRYVVDRCDVLIALWDGKPASGRGGTAEIVAYARERSCPLYWIDVEDGEISEELGRGYGTRRRVSD